MYYKGEDYEKLDKMALRLRIDYGHLNSRLDVFKLAKQLNIVLIKYSSLNEKQLKINIRFRRIKRWIYYYP